MTDHKHDQDENQKKEHHHHGMGLLGLAVAVAIGGAIGLMFTPKGEEIKKDLSDRAKVIAKKFKKSRDEVKKTVMDIFGEASEELEKAYIHIRGEIMASTEDAKDLSKNHYNKIVEDTVKHFSKGKDWTEKAVKKLTQNLEDEWNDLKNELKD